MSLPISFAVIVASQAEPFDNGQRPALGGLHQGRS
jgi:hypothetical protein